MVSIRTPENKAQLKLKRVRTKFEKEYEKVKSMTLKQRNEFRDKVNATEFKDLGSKDMVKALLTIVDDKETKKLVIEYMLKEGMITLNF